MELLKFRKKNVNIYHMIYIVFINKCDYIELIIYNIACMIFIFIIINAIDILQTISKVEVLVHVIYNRYSEI